PDSMSPMLKQPGWSETNTWVSPMSSSVSATLRAPSDDADVLLRLRVEMTLPKYDPMASRCVVHEPTVRRWRLACAKATESSRSAVRRSRPISTLPPCSEQVEVTSRWADDIADPPRRRTRADRDQRFDELTTMTA